MRTLSEATNAWYAFRSAMRTNPPFRSMIWRLMCFCRILSPPQPRPRSDHAAHARDEAEADLLVEDLEDLLARAPAEQRAVTREARERRARPRRRPDVRDVAVRARRRARLDDVLHLPRASGPQRTREGVGAGPAP
jgi:hypothetical protein